MIAMTVILVVALSVGVVLGRWLSRPRAVVNTIQAGDFIPGQVKAIAVVVRGSLGANSGFEIADPDTGKRLEFTGVSSMQAHMQIDQSTQRAKVAILLADVPVLPDGIQADASRELATVGMAGN